MYWVFPLLITPAISIGVIGIQNIAFTPGWLLGRQSSCSDCSSSEQCCAGGCIGADLTCCPDGAYYCLYTGEVCQPCPAGQTCYTIEGNLSPWTCCAAGSGVCTFIVSSSGSLATIITSVGSQLPPSSSTDTPTSSPSTDTPTSSLSPVAPTTPTSSLTPIASTPPPPSVQVVTVIYSPPTTSTLPASPTSISSSSTPSRPVQTSSVFLVTSANTATFVTSTISSSTHSSISAWNGTGPLLVGYCATPEFSLVYGPQTTAVYFIGVVGCVGDKPDCCPFQVSSTTTTVTTKTVTTTISETVRATTSVTNQLLFPSADSSGQSTLPRCPEDYETVSSVCCPSGYLLWDTLLGGIRPCYSTTSNHLTPPPNSEPSSANPQSTTEPSVLTFPGTPEIATSTIVNVVYAMNYPVAGAKPGLSTADDVGIGVGSAFAAALAASALLYTCWRRRHRERGAWYSSRERSPHSDERGSSVPPP